MQEKTGQNVNIRFIKRAFLILAFVMSFSFLCGVSVYADTAEDNIAYNRSLPIDSNEINDWPQGPVVSAESAILMEATTGTILYAKNIDKQEYPASCTKLLTCLIAWETCSMDETVTMSYDAIFDNPAGASGIALDVGNQLTMEECLNAILIRSANEVSFAVAEHITGTNWEDFADIMNERAAQLGCLNSHFVNPNGLPDEDHYTTAYDLAMIARAFFDSEVLSRISRTSRLHLYPTENQPKEIIENTTNQLLPGQPMEYEYLVGSKTGYTEEARNCLVSCAQKDGLKLICVVLKDESPYQFEDTIALFDYGFDNFKVVNVSEADTKYNIENTGFFYNGNDVFGSSQALLGISEDDFIVLPSYASYDEATSQISYDTEDEDQVALIKYTWNGVDVGTVAVTFKNAGGERYSFDRVSGEVQEEVEEETVVVINIFAAIVIILVIVVAVIITLAVIRKRHASSDRLTFSSAGRRRQRRRRRRKDFDYSLTANGGSLRSEHRRRKRVARRNRYRYKRHQRKFDRMDITQSRRNMYNNNNEMNEIKDEFDEHDT